MRTLARVSMAAALMLVGCAKHDSGRHDGDARKDVANGVARPLTLPSPPGATIGAATGDSASSDSARLQPGLWETTFTVNSFKAINVLADTTTTDAFGDVLLTTPEPRKTKACLSADDAAKGAPALMSGSGLASCRWMKLTTPPGSIDGSLICGQPTDHDAVRADVTGALLPNLFGTQLHMTIGDPAGSHIVGEAMMQGQRVGDCTADAAP